MDEWKQVFLMTEMSNHNEDGNTAPDSKDQMVTGSAWWPLRIFSRILGAVYIIPWGIWFGSYFSKVMHSMGRVITYIVSFWLRLLQGFHRQLRKQVAHYNAMNEYGVGFRLYKHGFILAALTGLVCAALLYFGASMFDGGDARVVRAALTGLGSFDYSSDESFSWLFPRVSANGAFCHFAICRAACSGSLHVRLRFYHYAGASW